MRPFRRTLRCESLASALARWCAFFMVRALAAWTQVCCMFVARSPFVRCHLVAYLLTIAFGMAFAAVLARTYQ